MVKTKLGLDQNIEGIKFMFRLSHFGLPVFNSTSFEVEGHTEYSKCDSREWFKKHCKRKVTTSPSSYTETTSYNRTHNAIFIGIQIKL